LLSLSVTDFRAARTRGTRHYGTFVCG
jgi:hypothetical protein